MHAAFDLRNARLGCPDPLCQMGQCIDWIALGGTRKASGKKALLWSAFLLWVGDAVDRQRRMTACFFRPQAAPQSTTISFPRMGCACVGKEQK